MDKIGVSSRSWAQECGMNGARTGPGAAPQYVSTYSYVPTVSKYVWVQMKLESTLFQLVLVESRDDQSLTQPDMVSI